MSQTERTLQLDKSRVPRAFDSTESLWQGEIKEVLALLQEHVSSLSALGEIQANTTSENDLPILSLAVFGGYGSGKTTFLRTLRKAINEERVRARFVGEQPELSHSNLSLYALEPVEPNKLAEDDNLLFGFLATALEDDQKRRRSQGVITPESVILSPVEQEFQRVSEYLHVLYEPESPQEYDPLGLTLERLERHTSGLRLKERLGDFLARLAGSALGETKSSVIVLPIDDIDMSMGKMIFNLEAFRRYLLHPQLVPIFTFSSGLAEELLSAYFEEALSKSQSSSPKALFGAPERESTAKNLAFQYLAKLFPVRNRIRLGPAPARVQAANYFQNLLEAWKTGGEETGRDVKILKLLERASTLLYGCGRAADPCVKVALRPASVRRQLQVVDAMTEADVDKEKGPADWAQLFDRSAWSLLYIHRDALKQFEVHLERLQGDTAFYLRRSLLGAVLALDPSSKLDLMRRFRFRIEDRGVQALSLLAASIFRPRIPRIEEYSGDNPNELKSQLPDKYQASEYALPMTIALTWFLSLWNGFYLPLVLARNRERDLSGVGWDLHSCPLSAARQALANSDVFSTGMMFLGPESLANELRSDDPELQVWLRLWCYYGYQFGEPSGMVSLWRGLALVGRLLVEFDRGPKSRHLRKGSENWEEEAKVRIEALLRRQIEAAKIPGTFDMGDQVGAGEEVARRGFLSFKSWDLQDGKGRRSESHIRKLAADIWQWLGEKVDVDGVNPKTRASKESDWRDCYIRRLHGEDLLGIFLHSLETSYFEDKAPSEENTKDSPRAGRWTARGVMESWMRDVQEYWKGDDLSVEPVLADCPLLKPFTSPRSKRKFLKAFERLEAARRVPQRK